MPTGCGRPLSDGNAVTLGEVMAELGIGRPAALRLVDGLPAARLGRSTRWRWGDVLARAFDTPPKPDEPPRRRRRGVSRQDGDWC